MSYSFAYGTGGEFIRPSARISIHHHSGCIFAETERMARYALEPTRHRNNQANSQQNVSSNDNNCSVDEVDNVMSKPSQPIRPPKPRNKDVRRGSFDLVCNGQSYHDESSNDVLSKSVPTTLPSQLYSSISSEDDDETYETLNSSHYSSRFEESISERSLNEKNKTFFSKATVWLIGVVFALCAVVCSGVFNVQNINSAAKYDKARFFTDLSALGEKYNIDENSILKIQMGISTISDKEDTGSFIFVYNSKFNFFNVEEFYNFVSDISLTAAKYLRNESRSAHYTTVDGARLDMDEHSDFMCKYREQFTRSGVMLVRNLEAVPSRLAMAFHYYCDEYNPVARRSAVLCTLDLAACGAGESTSKSLHSTIEACLRERWTTISPDSISPLLTRVVDVLVDVSKAFSKD